MLSTKTKYGVISPIIMAIWVWCMALSSCTDDLLWEPGQIPDGMVEIQGDVIFRPLVPTEIQTRSDAPDGSRYKGIRSLYVFFFDPEKNIIREYSGEVTDFTSLPSDGATHEHVSFKKTVRAGYYYVYAVANITASQKSLLSEVGTVDELRKIPLEWNDNIDEDLEMFGVFKVENNYGTNDGFEVDNLLTINKSMTIHSWVRRAVSKVTVDFDGSALEDGVTVYIKNAVLKHVASGALLGEDSRVNSENDDKSPAFECRNSSYVLTYGRGADHSGWPAVTRVSSFSPRDVWGDEATENFHDDSANALPCYENMQGEPGASKLQDSDGDGIIDSIMTDSNGDGKVDEDVKDGVTDGTFLEVEGYYVAKRPEYKSQGKIIYRFMLGQDSEKNYDLIRNHHYKITMRFKGYGNDVDWHIEYGEKYLDVSYPEDVNYLGKFFIPDLNYAVDLTGMPNGGHEFSDQNVITVTSFETYGIKNQWIEPIISYEWYSYNDQTGIWEKDNTSPGWLEMTEGDINADGSQKKYTFVASMADSVSVSINSLFPTGSVGSDKAPYNLSNATGGSVVENTANCYMVGAPGWYCFPLAYGNAITNKKDDNRAYSSSSIVNHLNNKITSGYILENPDMKERASRFKAKLIWEDAQNLIDPDNIIYDPGLFDGKGGVIFHIGTMAEGNAVIALIDPDTPVDQFVDDFKRPAPYENLKSTRAVWSWHIWATRIGFEAYAKDVTIINNDKEAFDIMPVNLGWCAGNRKIRYYKRRKCDIKFKLGDHEIIRTIEQYPHLVLPRGDHPYYQWGRKDPFVGTNIPNGNKERWVMEQDKYNEVTHYNTGSTYNPPKVYEEPKEYGQNDRRKHTKDCLDVLVRNPDKWHNAPRVPKVEGDFTQGFNSINLAPTDLWSNGGYKTIYDPCPPGYQIGSNLVYTGFTFTKENAIYSVNWYDVLEKNMLADYYGGSINSQVIEFYTDTRKIQSVIFPVTGYRDYDSHGQVIGYPDINNPTLSARTNGEGFVWCDNAFNQTRSYHLKFIREDLPANAAADAWKNRGGKSILGSFEHFFNCDGFAIRPVRIKR